MKAPIPVLLLITAFGVPGLLAEPGIPPNFVSEPAVPTLSPAVRDLAPIDPADDLFEYEAQRREDWGFVSPDVWVEPKISPLVAIQQRALRSTRALNLDQNFAGVQSGSSPPDDTGDVGMTYFLQGYNGGGGSGVRIYDKVGNLVTSFLMESLASGAPCNAGFSDPVIQYDELADRWMISEFDTSVNNLCVYVSQSNDPTGSWWSYTWDPPGGVQDYPKYAVWPDAYYVSVNNGGNVFALERQEMLAGNPATLQSFNIGTLSGFGFQLTMPGTMDGDPPPAGAPALFLRPRDTEIHGGTCPGCDLMEMWELSIDWATPGNSTLTPIAGIQMTDWDHTLCGTGSTWNCMPQPNTGQRIDPIREPIHYPLQYLNHGSHETLVGCFAEDVDGTDKAAVHWFEIRRTPVGVGSWALFQEGVLGGADAQHRSVCSAAMDQSGNMVVGYTRTGASSPFFPSIYYSGRLASDPLGTMPDFDNTIFDATTSKTNNERWGDYAGMGVDPADDCTFWFTTEYGGSGQTRIASMRFDECGCLATPDAPPGPAAGVSVDNQIDLSWNDSNTASILEYLVLRSTSMGGPYTQIAVVPDTSLGMGGVGSYNYFDSPVSGGTTYYYVIVASDGAACQSAPSTEVNATATGPCLLPPSFAGLASVSNPGAATCQLDLGWVAASPGCSGPVVYDVHRDTTSGFTPMPSNRIAAAVVGTGYSDATGLMDGVTYYYVVRAIENGVDDGNLVELAGTPTGPFTAGDWVDDVDTSPQFTGTGLWHVATASTCITPSSTSPPSAYYYGQDGSCTYDNGSANQGALTSPLIAGVSGGSQLVFESHLQTEQFAPYDNARVEVSTDGSSWNLIDEDQTNGGNIPDGGGSFSTRTYSLAGYAGSDIYVRFTFDTVDDFANTNLGWFIDDITVTNVQIPGSCVMGSGSVVPQEASALNETRAGKAGGTSVELVYQPACGAVDNVVLLGSSATPLAGLNWTNAFCPIGNTGLATFDPGNPAPGSFYYFVPVANDGSEEGSYGQDSSGGERPEASGIGCDFPQNLVGSCP